MPGSDAIGPHTYVVSPLESPPEVTHEPDSSRGCTWAFNRLVAHCCHKRPDSETNSQNERYEENYSLPYLSTSDQIPPMESVPITEKPIFEVVTVSPVIEASPLPETHNGLTPKYGWGKSVEGTRSANPVTQLLGLSREKVIGAGAMAEVCLYKDSATNIKFAVKEILKKEERAFSPYKGEACGLLIPAHSNIARTLALIIYDKSQQSRCV